ncbi:hypothetical protein ACL598_18830 [Bordetella bronchialis]|uniref:hypothetical protein n=1 Tax=Bordetella bronchialis TaxID=463025 RepID=UPI003CFEC6BE
MNTPILQLGGPYGGMIVKATNPPIDHIAYITQPECVYLLRTYRLAPTGAGVPQSRQFYVWREMDDAEALKEVQANWELGHLVDGPDNGIH